MYGTVVFAPIGAGLLSTLSVDSPSREWIGFQVIFGIGIGMGFQQPLICAQAALPLADIPIGTAIMMFSQILGGAVISSVGQNVFTNQLQRNVLERVPDMDATIALTAGATEITRIVPPQFLDAFLGAYNDAITESFYVAAALSALAAIPLAFVQWKSVKGQAIVPAAV